MSYPNGPQCVLWHHRREGGNTTLQIVRLQVGRTGSIWVQWNPESHHYSHFIYQSCKAVGLLCPQDYSRRKCSTLNCMFVLNCLNRCEGGNPTLQIVSLLLGRTGSIRVQWNPESHHYSHFIYQSCKAIGMLCPQEGSRRNFSTLNCMFVLQRLNVCYGKSIYYFAAPMTDTTAIFGSVTSHRLDILSWIHSRRT